MAWADFVNVYSWLSVTNPKSKIVSRLTMVQVIFCAMTDAPRSVTNCLFLLVVCYTSVALADDFTTINGKEYKNATISRVEADGIVIRTKTGIAKIYFAELPKDVQERFRHGSATPTGKAATQVIDGQSFADKFAERVQNRLDERESILHGKHTPGPQS